MRILLSNDDGVAATGLRTLHKWLKKTHAVTVVAPVEEKSTSGHSLTLNAPLRLYKFEPQVFAINGGPADCVHLALNEKEVMAHKPDLVVSGINRGANMGQDVFYSGTLSAAREATFWGVPGVAVSLAVEKNDKVLNYDAASKALLEVVKMIQRKKIKLPPYTILNVNVPNVPYSEIKGFKVAFQGFQIYNGKVLQRHDMRGRKYYWIGGLYAGYRKILDSDCDIVYRQQKVAISALQVRCEHAEVQEQLKEIWS